MTRPRVRRTVAVPAVPLSYVLWDGTNASDSRALAVRLNALRWHNQVQSGDALATGRPAVLQPAGADGFTESDDLFFRGMFEFPRAVFGAALRGERSGHGGSFLAVSGHGVPGFMFSESLVPIAMSQPMTTSASDAASSPGQWSYASRPAWPAETRVCLFSACRQLQGQPQQSYWASAMRASGRVHAILSYHQTAPSARASAALNRTFFSRLQRGESFLDAWKGAHSSDALSWRWAALIFEECVGDTLLEWNRTGDFASRPDAARSRVLYFDRDTPSGTPVTEPAKPIDCWLTHRGSTGRIPPWYLCGNHAAMDLHIRILDPAWRMERDDVVVVVASQVRPDYAGPFSIQGLFTLDAEAALRAANEIQVRRVIHENVPDYGDDAYYVRLGTAVPPPADGRNLVLPIRLGAAQNDHIPLYYFHIALLKGGEPSNRIGIPNRVIDDFQHAMFRLPWP